MSAIAAILPFDVMAARPAADDWQSGVDPAARGRLDVAAMPPAPDFHQLVAEHYGPLLRFAQSLCRGRGLAEDLVQQTFLQWARKGHTLREAARARTWLFTTLYREWLSVARREQRHEMVEFEPDLHGGEVEPRPEPPRVDSATLQQALDALDVNYRAPLVLFYMRELSYKDIAETLGLPIGTVMSRLSRAKDALRRALSSIPDLDLPHP